MLSPEEHKALLSEIKPFGGHLVLRGKWSLLGRVFSWLVSKGLFQVHHGERLKKLKESGEVVFALKYRSLLDLTYLTERLGRESLPAPGALFDATSYFWRPLWETLSLTLSTIRHLLKRGRFPNPYEAGFYDKILDRGLSPLMFLVGTKGYYQRSILAGGDPLVLLLERQKRTDRPIFVAPFIVLFGRKADRTEASLLDIFFGPGEDPGALRKILSFLRNFRWAGLTLGEALNLKEFLGEPENARKDVHELAYEARRKLIDSVDDMRRVALGPLKKTRLEMKEMVLNSPRMRKYIDRLARSRKVDHMKVRKEADGYLNEISTDLSNTFVQVWDLILRWVWRTIFDGIEVDEAALERVRAMAKRGVLVYIPCHKSHIDYLLLSQILYSKNISVPLIAAGQNLAFWPLGYIFRKSGAFFLRRTFQGSKFYTEVFANYIRTVLKEGYPIEYFIEGGRSRTGKLVLPKMGLLAMLISACEEGWCDDLIFVPTSITYDRVLEEDAYLREITGGTKEKESLRQLLSLSRHLKKRYGKIYLKFSEPISLKDYISNLGQELSSMRPRFRYAIFRDMAYRIIRRINDNMVLTPFALVSAACLATPRRGISMAEITQICRLYTDFMREEEVIFSGTLGTIEPAVEGTLNIMVSGKLLEMMSIDGVSGPEDLFYAVDEKSRLKLEFYKNGMVHFILPAAYVSASILSKAGYRARFPEIVDDYEFLQDFFKYEFVWDAEKKTENEAQRVLSYLEDRDFVTLDAKTGEYRATVTGLKSLQYFAAPLIAYFESYQMVLKGLGSFLDHKTLTEKELMKRLQSGGQKLHKRGLLDRSEALSRVTFENALSFYHQKGVLVRRQTAEGGKVATNYSLPQDHETGHIFAQRIQGFLSPLKTGL